MVNSVFERLLVNHRFLLTLLASTDSWIVFQCGSVLLERGEVRQSGEGCVRGPQELPGQIAIAALFKVLCGGAEVRQLPGDEGVVAIFMFGFYGQQISPRENFQPNFRGRPLVAAVKAPQKVRKV